MRYGRSPVLKKGTEMAKKKKRVVSRAWTKDDLRLLKSMARDKKGVTKIAKALKRSPGATSVMAAKHGVSLSTRG
jgi:murein endopeptidase